MEYGRNSIADESAFKMPSCKSGDILGAYGARYGVPKFSKEARSAMMIMVRIIIPTKPKTALMQRYKKIKFDICPT